MRVGVLGCSVSSDLVLFFDSLMVEPRLRKVSDQSLDRRLRLKACN